MNNIHPAQQNLKYTVELSKPYRIVLESWESVQALSFYHFFARPMFRPRAERMQLSGYNGAHGYFRVIKREQIDSRRVDLPVGFCLES